MLLMVRMLGLLPLSTAGSPAILEEGAPLDL